MPAIFVEAGPMTGEQKQQLGKRLTEDMSDVLGIEQKNILLFMRENPLDNITVGGVSVAELKKRAGK
ncbi:MAG: tautomerase family protein [Selenomonas sp.]|nr:tautomerase family protein [Selenomonas sp.]